MLYRRTFRMLQLARYPGEETGSSTTLCNPKHQPLSTAKQLKQFKQERGKKILISTSTLYIMYIVKYIGHWVTFLYVILCCTDGSGNFVPKLAPPSGFTDSHDISGNNDYDNREQRDRNHEPHDEWPGHRRNGSANSSQHQRHLRDFVIAVWELLLSEIAIDEHKLLKNSMVILPERVLHYNCYKYIVPYICESKAQYVA